MWTKVLRFLVRYEKTMGEHGGHCDPDPPSGRRGHCD